MPIDIKNLLAKIGLKNEKEELNIQSEKYKYVSVLRMLSILTIIILITIVTGTMFFVYTSIMNTIGQVESITIYQSELRIELIDFTRLERVERKWNEKFNIKELSIERNPFTKFVPPAPIEEKPSEEVLNP